MKQISFFDSSENFFGGSLKGKRSKRPLCSKRSVHLVLKAKSKNLFTKNRKIEHYINRYSKRFGVKVYGLSIQKDHVHFLIRIHSRALYIKFIRTLTGILSRLLGIQWKVRPFTRIVCWGRGFRSALDYIRQNQEEILGLRKYKIRTTRYKLAPD